MQPITLSWTKSGIGDSDNYWYHHGYGGSVAPADEGVIPLAFGSGEAAATATGTVKTSGGGTGTTTLSVTCITDCGPPASWGDGRYIVDLTSNVLSGNVKQVTNNSGYVPVELTTDFTVPVSTFWGTVSTLVTTPTATPLGRGTTSMNITVASTTLNGVANTGAPAVGDLMCVSGTYHEQFKVTAVSGSGPLDRYCTAASFDSCRCCRIF